VRSLNACIEADIFTISGIRHVACKSYEDNGMCMIRKPRAAVNVRAELISIFRYVDATDR